jgi:hypothetical protein
MLGTPLSYTTEISHRLSVSATMYLKFGRLRIADPL